MKSFYNLFLILCLLLPLSLFAQEDSETVIEEPPTLSLGLDNIVFNQGTIDVEVLSEIIASKKEELKKEVIRRVILSNMDGASFTFYNYAENVLELILNPNNLKVATRSLLEYTANFALVYGFTELYLQLGIKTKDVELARVIEAYNEIQTLENQDLVGYAKKINTSIDVTNFPIFQSDKIFLLSYLKNIPANWEISKEITRLDRKKNRKDDKKKELKLLLDNINSTSNRAIKLQQNIDKLDYEINKIDDEITLLTQKKNAYENKDYCPICPLSSILLDLTFDVAKNSPEIQKKGFFVQELNISNEEYVFRSCYKVDFLSELERLEGKCNEVSFSDLVSFYKGTSLDNNDFLLLKQSLIQQIDQKYQVVENEKNKILKVIQDSLRSGLNQHVLELKIYENLVNQIKKPELKTFKDLQTYIEFVDKFTSDLEKFDRPNNFNNIEINILKAKFNELKKLNFSKLELEFLKTIQINLKGSSICDILLKNEFIASNLRTEIERINTEDIILPVFNLDTLKNILVPSFVDSLEGIDTLRILAEREKLLSPELKQNLVNLYDKLNTNKNDCGCQKIKFWIAIELLRLEMTNTTTAFFQYYEVLKETDFLKGNTFEEILMVFNDYVNEESERIRKLINDNDQNIYDKITIKTQEDAVFRSNTSAITNIKSTRQGAFDLSRSDSLFSKLVGAMNSFQVNGNSVINPDTITSIKISIEKLHMNWGAIGDDDLANSLINLATKISNIQNKDFISPPLFNENDRRDIFLIFKKAEDYINSSRKIENLEIEINNIRNQNRILEQSLIINTNQNTFFQSSLKKIENTLFNLRSDSSKLSLSEQKSIQKLYETITDLKNPNKKYNNMRFANFILDSLNAELALINTKVNGKLTKAIESLELIAFNIKIDILEKFKPYFENIKDIAYVNPKQFIEFITKLNELDKSETYDYLFKILIDAGNVLAEEGNSQIFNSIINNVKKYTSINADSNAIDVDIETISADLFNKYGDRGGNINFYFSIGLNQGFLPEGKTLTVGEEEISNIGFASEKIGVKWKYWNFEKKLAKRFDENYQYTRAKYRPKQPIITDMYLLTYGSGILYNLTNTTTAGEDFNFPLWGIGSGISFFNALDFNVSYTVPFLPNERFAKNFDYGFVNVGFDIKITEYLEALGKKRRERKATED